MIQRQSDSFSRFAHSSTLLSTFFFSLSLCLRFSLRSPPSPDVAAVSAASSARQRAEGVGWRRKKRRASGGGGRREKPQSSRETLTRLTSVRVYRKGSRANARDVLRPSYVRKLKS